MKFAEFNKIVSEAGLTAKLCATNHWQILGGIKPVNLHRDQKGKLACIYVNGMSKGMRGPNLSLETAIAAAKYGIIQPEVKEERIGQSKAKKIRARLYETEKRCYWCGKRLAWEETTLDHIIALDVGGSNRRDNFCIACWPCNRTKGNSAVWPEVTKERAVDAVFSEIGN